MFARGFMERITAFTLATYPSPIPKSVVSVIKPGVASLLLLYRSAKAHDENGNNDKQD
jgi:hypothetical protein